jgi:penicillin amidase
VLFHTPLLRTVNLSIAVLLGLLLAAGYWFGWRTLPKTSGAIVAPIAQQAVIVRDSLGVPHITAGSWEDAVFLQGFAVAQDRMWQLDAMRRLPAGELSAVVGRVALDSDREARRWRLPEIAEAQERTLTPESRAALAAYARGVNYYLETNRGRLPPEFALLGYDPRPWSIRDSILIGLEMFRRLTASWRDKMEKQHMLDSGDASLVNFLYPRRTGGEVHPGSNAWVISGAHSASGKPILANDPHLEWSVPGTWHLIHLKAPGLDVTGADLPGIPGVVIGHNRSIAWGVTNLEFDVQDVYREQIDLRTGRYVYQGQTMQAGFDRDAIAVKGQKPVDAGAWVTRHGPVFLNEANVSYSMRWMGAEDTLSYVPFLDLNRAGNWDEFNAVLSRYGGPAQNFVYADASGNIGYHAAGKLPVHAVCPADVPMDGASGECEWAGFIPYDQLPHAYNPPSGMIVTSNQNPFPEDYPFPVYGRFASKYRSQQIRARLESHMQWTPQQMLGIQTDVYSAQLRFLAQQTVAAWDKHPGSDSHLKGAADVLRSWNGEMEKRTAAPMMAQLIYVRLREAVAARAASSAAEDYESFLAPEVVERLLRERPPVWFSDFDALLLKCLGQAYTDGQKTQGSNVSHWDYGQFNRLTVRNPVVGELPVIGKYFNIGPVPMSGASTTVKQTTSRIGPSLRMVVDFADLDRSLANTTLGESGHPLSRHYSDEWDAYYAGRSFPMRFDRIDPKQTLTVNPLSLK